MWHSAGPGHTKVLPLVTSKPSSAIRGLPDMPGTSIRCHVTAPYTLEVTPWGPWRPAAVATPMPLDVDAMPTPFCRALAV